MIITIIIISIIHHSACLSHSVPSELGLYHIEHLLHFDDFASLHLFISLYETHLFSISIYSSIHVEHLVLSVEHISHSDEH